MYYFKDIQEKILKNLNILKQYNVIKILIKDDDNKDYPKILFFTLNKIINKKELDFWKKFLNEFGYDASVGNEHRWEIYGCEKYGWKIINLSF